VILFFVSSDSLYDCAKRVVDHRHIYCENAFDGTHTLKGIHQPEE
jgi:hypothetical protein